MCKSVVVAIQKIEGTFNSDVHRIIYIRSTGTKMCWQVWKRTCGFDKNKEKKIHLFWKCCPSELWKPSGTYALLTLKMILCMTLENINLCENGKEWFDSN